MPTSPRKLLTIDEAADRLRVATSTVYGYVRRGVAGVEVTDPDDIQAVKRYVHGEAGMSRLVRKYSEMAGNEEG